MLTHTHKCTAECVLLFPCTVTTHCSVLCMFRAYQHDATHCVTGHARTHFTTQFNSSQAETNKFAPAICTVVEKWLVVPITALSNAADGAELKIGKSRRSIRHLRNRERPKDDLKLITCDVFGDGTPVHNKMPRNWQPLHAHGPQNPSN